MENYAVGSLATLLKYYITENRRQSIKDYQNTDVAKVSYLEYIQSDEWKIKSDDAKERAGWRCQLCNCHESERTLNTHHRTYENLGHELDTDLTVLCDKCHSKFHDKGDDVQHI